MLDASQLVSRQRLELRAHLEALPIHQLRRIEHFEEGSLTLATQREQLAEQLARLPESRRRFGRSMIPTRSSGPT